MAFNLNLPSFNSRPGRGSVWQKQIPTLLGVGVLVAALAAGVFFIGQGPGVFAPRAAPETTPQKVRVTNVTDTSFTVSFFTQEATPGYVRYGTDANTLRSQASDDRDQLSGTVGSYNLHHVTLRGLSPNTTYYYELGTGSSRATFDNNGSAFMQKTAQRGGAPSAAQTVYGNVLNADGSPADGAIVYATLEGVSPLSSLVKSTGSWAIPLANARSADGSGYAKISDTSPMTLFVQAEQANLTTQQTLQVADAEPAENITLGGSSQPSLSASSDGAARNTNQNTQTDTSREEVGLEADSTDTNRLSNSGSNSASEDVSLSNSTGNTGTGGNTGGGLLGTNNFTESSNTGSDQNSGDTSNNDIVGTTNPDTMTGDSMTAGSDTTSTTSASSDSTSDSFSLSTGTSATGPSQENVVDVDSADDQTVTAPPKIIGEAAPNATVRIEVNSETQIITSVNSDSSGNFELDLASIAEANDLEPGEHSITVTYTNENGQTVTKQQTFTLTEAGTTYTGTGSTESLGTGGAFETSGSDLLAQANTDSTTGTADTGPYSSGNPYSISTSSSQTATSSTTSTRTSTRSSVVATTSALPKSGSVGTTMALVLGGLFFITAGVWSFWIAQQLEPAELADPQI